MERQRGQTPIAEPGMACTAGPVSALDNGNASAGHGAESTSNGSDEQYGDSELGRKEHWDEVYACELANLQEHGDEGELWCV